MIVRRSIETAAGVLALRARSDEPEFFAALARHIADAASRERVIAEPFEFGTAQVWIKGDHLPGKARVRHSLYALLGRPTPREREFERLGWMRARLFRTPQPVCAGSIRSRGVLRYQFLAMAPLGEHEPLADALTSATVLERRAWIRELAREAARLHTLHFVHRNLFFRNVVLDRTPPPSLGDPRRLILLDPWRGGAALPRRGADYDLGALMLDAAEVWSFDEQLEFVQSYFDERAAQERPARPLELLAAAAQRRLELARRARAANPAEWNWRALAAATRTGSRAPGRPA